MTVRLAMVMDPIASIDIKKDSSFAMLLAAQARGWELGYLELNDLFLRDQRIYGRAQPVRVRDDPSDWFDLGEAKLAPLETFDVVLMRKDPPFDMEYIIATYLLERAQHQGCLVVNDPRALRDANEKIFATDFPELAPAHLVARDGADLRAFIAEQQDTVLKPLDGMGGRSVFRVRADDPNLGVIIETLTNNGQRFCMAQRFIPEITDGDKRVLIIDGEPVPHLLARIPTGTDSRGNLAAGALGQVRPLGDAERRIAEQVGPVLSERGIVFAGLDVIGEFLTEINITSPTCIREIDRERDTDIAGDLMEAIARRLNAR
ncbi:MULTISPECIES: glutathione synthase [Thiorhodovibrio]|uniref:glutathione synthase n=1 Tax=Thiorhodovibrio TaxID=61593 RepID=UPI0019132BAE|nr:MULTISPECIES: glutathione synthase [Thiorhodovibrio]MBK5967767.1 glutathione synthase [Thiorhodovibrio winogradskyi]WPL14428.1 Glutathione synthetase [Thiorhodovibrio litoralis]